MCKKLICYVGIQNIPKVELKDLEILDTINLAFGHIKNGKVVCPLLKNMTSYMEEWKAVNSKLKIILSIGGWSSGGFSEAAETSEGRKVFSETAVNLVEKYGFDGIDIDWEYPCVSIAGIKAMPEDKENFTLLLAQIREELDKYSKSYILSIAGGGDRYFTRSTNLLEASKYLDYVQIMSYDLRGGFVSATGHHANPYNNSADLFNVSMAEGVKAYLEAGIPREKLVVGAAFYGRTWKGVKNLNNGLMQAAETCGDYGANYSDLLKNYINKNGFTRYWDDEAKAPYLFNGSTFISYEDEYSIAEKANYIKENGLLGVMCWEYGCDETHTLLRNLYNILRMCVPT